MSRERTMFADKHGKEIFLGDIVRAEIKPPFQEVHGTWAEYEITKGPGGYLLFYSRSETGAQLPFGYTAQFMNQYDDDDLPDLKTLLFSTKPVEHPSLEIVDDGMTPEQRRELFMVECRARRDAGK
jgi:hypothetical protein